MAEKEMSSAIVSSSEYNENEVSGNYECWKTYESDTFKHRRSKSRDRGREKSRERHRSRDRHSKSSSSRRKRSRSRNRHSSSRNKHSRSRNRDSRSERRELSLEFKKLYKYWDVPPPGYENMSPAEFKAMQAAGQVLPTLYMTEGSVMSLVVAESMLDSHQSLGSAVSRQARRIYVGNIPLGVTEQSMMDFFNEQVKLKGYTQAEGEPVIAVQINADKNFAFLEFRSVEETSQGLNLDGVMYNGFPLKLRRPRDYVPLPVDSIMAAAAAAVPGVVQDTPHKLFIGGLPHYLNEEQVKELLLTFGQLSGFNLVKDAATGLSKGYAFCEYADHSVTDKACLGLTGMQLGEKRIVVQRASLGAKNPASTTNTALMMVRSQQQIEPYLSAGGGGSGAAAGGQETEILCLHNMITVEDLEDDEEYEEIVEDIKEECSKYGRVQSVQVPRQCEGVDKAAATSRGVGKVYVEFSNKSETVKAMRALAGRTFSGRVVVTSFYDPERYRNGFF